jgi:hypothetical protein
VVFVGLCLAAEHCRQQQAGQNRFSCLQFAHRRGSRVVKQGGFTV